MDTTTETHHQFKLKNHFILSHQTELIRQIKALYYGLWTSFKSELDHISEWKTNVNAVIQEALFIPREVAVQQLWNKGENKNRQIRQNKANIQ